MIVQDQIEKSRRIRHGTGGGQVMLAWLRIARRMVVRHDQPGRAKIKGAANDLAREDVGLRDTAARGDLVPHDTVLGVEIEDTDLLRGFMGHRRMKIAHRRTVVGHDGAIQHFGLEHIPDERPNREQKIDEIGPIGGELLFEHPAIGAEQRGKRAEPGEKGDGKSGRIRPTQWRQQGGEMPLAVRSHGLTERLPAVLALLGGIAG